ncbi:Uncharacterised protein [Streptococcus equi subsp. equi]|nr:Uncharacterised protein [Streptococcus equi subsp. equi]CRT62799.1 Uncharacterised protein [Streptococcus equi subsp. equi]
MPEDLKGLNICHGPNMVKLSTGLKVSLDEFK